MCTENTKANLAQYLLANRVTIHTLLSHEINRMQAIIKADATLEPVYRESIRHYTEMANTLEKLAVKEFIG